MTSPPRPDSPRIAVAGGYGVGMTMRTVALPRPGETVTGGALSVGPGGKGSNQAIGAARLGATVSLFTAIGSDSAAEDARRLWDEEGVDSSAVIVSSQPTMTGFILVDDGGENSIAIAPGALDTLAPSDAESFRSAIAGSDLLVVSLEIPSVTAARLLAIARDEGVRTLLNPAPATPMPLDSWTLVDILTPNRGEAATILGRADDDPAAAAAALHELTGGIIFMTLGAEGVLVFDGTATAVPPATPKEVVDTTGAGDAFTAALAVAIASGLDVVAAATWARHAGAHAVSIAEVIPALARLGDLPALA